MHSLHYDDWAFHANGDPVPGDVLINPRGEMENRLTFRTTAEEILVFVMASKLEAIGLGQSVSLRTTMFQISLDIIADIDTVTLTAISPRESDDASTLVIPLKHLISFAEDVARQRFECHLEELDDGNAVLAGIGAFMLFTKDRSNDGE